MSEHTKSNPPAFPAISFDDYGNTRMDRKGMSLRDWFAGQTLAGAASTMALGDQSDDDIADACLDLARVCYVMADAMLLERAKGRES